MIFHKNIYDYEKKRREEWKNSTFVLDFYLCSFVPVCISNGSTMSRVVNKLVRSNVPVPFLIEIINKSMRKGY